jgi:hypothetical protein
MRLLSENPLSGVKVYHDWDDDAQQHIFRTDIDRIVSKAVVERNKAIEGHNMGKEMRLAASIPPEVQFEWLDKFGIEFWNPAHADGVKRLLNSNEYRYLRVNHFML